MNRLYRHIVTIKLPIMALIIVSITVVFSVAVVDKIYADEAHVAGQVGFYGTPHKEENLPSISVLPRPGVGGAGDAIPYSVGQEGLDDFNKAESLVNFLYDNIYGNIVTDTHEHKKAGATYIVCTMLGQKTFQDCEKRGYSDEYRQILSAGWTELRLRLHNPDIEISWYEYLPFENFINTMYDPDDNDIYYYTRTETTTRYTIIIRDKADKTKVYYRLFRQCANPIGGIDGLPVVTSKKWSLHATSTSSVNGGASSAETKDAKPSDTITWNHNLYNNNDSLSATTMGISSNLGITGFNSANYTKSDGYSNPGVGPGAIIRTISGDYSTHKVVQDDVGKKLCERVQYDPQNSDNKRDGYNDSSCVEVPYNFNLTATTRIEEGGDKPNSSISFHHLLTNVGATKSKEDVDFHTLMLRVPSAENSKPTETQIVDVVGAKDKKDIMSQQDFNAPAATTGTDDGKPVILKDDVSEDSTYSITQADVGNWICGYMYAKPKSSESQEEVRSFECQYIPYNFNLTATTTVHNDKNFAPGSQIYFNYTRTNNGPTKTNTKVTSSTSMTRVYGDAYKKAVAIGDEAVFTAAHAPAIGDIAPPERLVPNLKNSAWEIDPMNTFNKDGFPMLLSPNIEGTHYTIKQADVGNSICGIIAVNPHSSEDSSDTFSYSCKYIPYNFSLKPETKIKVDNSAPESPITFQHKITNDGPTKTNDDVSYFTRIVRVSPKSSDITIDDVVAGTELKKTKYNSISAADTVNKDGSLKGLLKDWFDDTLDKIAQDDVNNWVCSYLSAKPASQDNADYVSSFICKFIPYDYTLTPSVTVNPSEYIESGATYTVSPSVNNSGPTKSESTEWQLTRTIVSSGNAIDNIAGGISDTEPCTYYNNANAVCSPVKTGNTVFNSNSTWLSGDVLNNYISEADDYAVGTRICFALSVKPYKNGENKWSHSVAVCRVVVKKPKVQVWGGDLISGGKVSSSTSIKNGAMFGSWVEYGIFSAGLINGTASGSAFAGNGLTPISTPVSPCGYSMLSFVNAGTSACSSSSIIGNYTSSWPVTDIAASFPGDGEPISGTFVPSSTGEGVHIYSAGDLKLDTSNLVSKKTIIIKASGTVTIIGNQTYSNGPYTNTSDLPQLVIIANKIVINGNVENVDAWLVTKDGFIKTCDVVGDTVTKCDHKLTVNGPVIAKTLYLYRTAGSGTGDASGDPAEIFNLRADAYLWATARANVNNKIQTVYTTELPPRF